MKKFTPHLLLFFVLFTALPICAMQKTKKQKRYEKNIKKAALACAQAEITKLQTENIDLRSTLDAFPEREKNLEKRVAAFTAQVREHKKALAQATSQYVEAIINEKQHTIDTLKKEAQARIERDKTLRKFLTLSHEQRRKHMANLATLQRKTQVINMLCTTLDNEIGLSTKAKPLGVDFEPKSGTAPLATLTSLIAAGSALNTLVQNIHVYEKEDAEWTESDEDEKTPNAISFE